MSTYIVLDANNQEVGRYATIREAETHRDSLLPKIVKVASPSIEDRYRDIRNRAPAIWARLYSILPQHPYLAIRAARVLVTAGAGYETGNKESVKPFYKAIQPVLQKAGFGSWERVRDVALSDLRGV